MDGMVVTMNIEADNKKAAQSPRGNWPLWFNELWNEKIYGIKKTMLADTARTDTTNAPVQE